jgi:hypothetical protein
MIEERKEGSMEGRKEGTFHPDDAAHFVVPYPEGYCRWFMPWGGRG